MSIGMSYEQYWNSSPYLVIAYREAHKLRKEQLNEQLWLQGAYIYEAFSVVMANAFAKKGSKRQNYPVKPYDLYKKSEREMKLDAENERNKAIDSLNALKGMMDFKFKGDTNGSNS